MNGLNENNEMLLFVERVLKFAGHFERHSLFGRNVDALARAWVKGSSRLAVHHVEGAQPTEAESSFREKSGRNVVLQNDRNKKVGEEKHTAHNSP